MNHIIVELVANRLETSDIQNLALTSSEFFKCIKSSNKFICRILQEHYMHLTNLEIKAKISLDNLYNEILNIESALASYNPNKIRYCDFVYTKGPNKKKKCANTFVCKFGSTRCPDHANHHNTTQCMDRYNNLQEIYKKKNNDYDYVDSHIGIINDRIKMISSTRNTIFKKLRIT